ncbi:MAG TPA: histidine--tRNA ligase [Solirubrobacteraceae bacterium]|nr:histidine--tRNA ligase [Solirubrobacteraceae bacterium]
MSAAKLKAPRGTHDVLGEQAAARARVESAARALLEGAGYARIETPTFEATELFARGVGASTDIVQKEMYTFTDGGGRSLTLRPEGTAPVCRAYVEHGMHKLRAPVKLWYLSSFYRYERAQAGRQRQFWQVGAEALGSEEPAVDAESIVLLCALLDELDVREVRLRLSSLGGPDARAAYRERLQAHLRAHEAALAPEVRERIDLNPLRAFDSEHDGTRAVMATAPRLLDHLSTDDQSHFAEVRALLDEAGVAYAIDPTLVRGLDYYTRTVFELTSDALGAQSGVGGGGRYDGLVAQLGGPSTPGMGWAMGIERALLAGDARAEASPAIDLFVAVSDGAARPAFKLLHEARTAGLAAQMELAGRSLKNQLAHAERLGARYVAVVGAGGDGASGAGGAGTQLKDVQAHTQEEISADAVVHAVLRGRGAL